MKKLLFILCYVSFLFIFSSCQQCVTCTATATVNGDVISTSTTEFCGNAAAINDYEQTTTTEAGGITTTTSIVCD
tara:strand:+ start:124 stop:348 length:225 start_codon:yes stop_codon:yes gene_type:complete